MVYLGVVGIAACTLRSGSSAATLRHSVVGRSRPTAAKAAVTGCAEFHCRSAAGSGRSGSSSEE